MAKKSNVPESIEKQFNKALFKEGEPVLFTWLGAKKYGYVKTYKKVSWGIQYSILSFGTTYPCGIQIKTYRTSYHVGCILFEETTGYGVNKLKNRIDSGPEPLRDTEIFRDSQRPNNEGGSNDTSLRGNANNINRKTKSNTARPDRVENDVQPSNNGVQQRNTKKRKNHELDTAIERQRNFLNGFVKKD